MYIPSRLALEDVSTLQMQCEVADTLRLTVDTYITYVMNGVIKLTNGSSLAYILVTANKYDKVEYVGMY